MRRALAVKFMPVDLFPRTGLLARAEAGVLRHGLDGGAQLG
jgi:hypothetical protein